MKRMLITSTLCIALSGCATGAPDIMVIQQATATRLGLSSTDEVTISNTVKATPDALGASKVTFEATTAKGRKFACYTTMMPSLNPLDKPTYTDFECQPK